LAQDAVADIHATTGPLTVNHLGQLPAVTLSFNTLPGVSLGDAVSRIEAAIANIVPAGVSTQFQGEAGAFQESLGKLGLLVIMAVLVIYLVLGILYESFIHPADHTVRPSFRGCWRVSHPDALS
jgi:multidrug efflux pump subunit AcrB